MGGVDHAVDYIWIAAAGDVVESSAKSEVVAEEMEALFQLEIQRQVFGEAMLSGFADELLLVGELAEGESGAGFHGVGDFKAMDDRQIEKWKVSPGEEAVRRIPRIRAGLLRAEDVVVDVEIERLVGSCAGTSVGAHEHVGFAEIAAESDLERVVVIVARVLQDEVAAGESGSVINEAAGTAALKIFSLGVNGSGEFFFER